MSKVLSKPRLKSSEVEAQFTTLLMTRQYDGVEELNNALSALMHRLETASQNHADTTSNIGGFHSDTKFFSRAEPEIAAVRDMIGEAVQQYIVQFVQENCATPPPDMKIRLWGWGINMREGDVNTQHCHPNAKVSGVYYVAIPKSQHGGTRAKPGGSIMFCDPRPRAHMNQMANQITEIVVPPEEGMMVLFPSYYEHCVIPFKGTGVRTCIAFNAQF